MATTCTGIPIFALHHYSSDKNLSRTTSRSKGRTFISSTVSCSSSHALPSIGTPPEQASADSTYTDTNTDNDTNTSTPQKFTYSRALPSVRWPHLKLSENNYPPPPQTLSQSLPSRAVEDDDSDSLDSVERTEEAVQDVGMGFSRNKVKKMNKLALKRAKDWRERVKFYTDRILGLGPNEFVADVLDDRAVQMTPVDYCFVVKWVGQSNWQRALEVYEWLNLRHWYSPNARMLATILAVLGKANQQALAVEIFDRVESSAGSTVQVYNAMMGVYARNGRFSKVQELLDLMQERGCEPDLVSFNTLINARLKSNPVEPNLALELLDEVRKSGLRPDIITYNTLLSACSRDSNLKEAAKVFADMEAWNCQPDLWTYNAMISVYGRCGLSDKAEELFKELESRGFFPDAVTYNSLLYAFAREGKVEKVREICEEMVKKGFGKDEMTYNTIIHMYGKQGQHDVALQVYKDMKSSGRDPDAVTYTILIDSLGKANRIKEAAVVMSEMLDAGVKPTVRTYSALICAFAKVGQRMEAEETFTCMLRSGIKPDQLAYSVMMDILLRCNGMKKAMKLYKDMVHDGFYPDHTLYEAMLQALAREEDAENVERVMGDIEKLHAVKPHLACSILVKGECYDRAADMLRLAVRSGHSLDRDNLLSILSSFSSSGRHSEALELLEFLRQHTGPSPLISEALIVLLCKADQVDTALDEYTRAVGFSAFSRSSIIYESLVQCCQEKECFAEASQVLTDMRFYAVEPSIRLYHMMVHVYCRMSFPETAHFLVEQAEARGIIFEDSSTYVSIIEAYGAQKLWQKAESLVGSLRQRRTLDRKVWNALIQAYAASGRYEQARAVFNVMMRDGPAPTVESINGLFQALITDGRLEELYVVIEDLQDMGFKISKSSILMMLDAFARAGNIFEVKKIYAGMRAAGYFPTMHLYRTMIVLFSKGKRVKDVEAMVSEMEEAGFKPDLSIWNSMLKLYTVIEDFKRTAQVYQQIQAAGLKPDEDTYNTLIVMYCRDRRPEEGLSLLNEMRRLGLDPKLDTYKSLISALGKQQLLGQAEELFEELRSRGCKLDRSFYHIMMKLFRNSGNHSKAEKLLGMMESSGIEATIATMHLLMTSYGSSGQPREAERVLNNIKATGVGLSTLPYSSVIDAYLRNGDYNIAIENLGKMRDEGLEPDHRIWTCFLRAASLCQYSSEAINLLNALHNVGFNLPSRLLSEQGTLIHSEVEDCLDKLKLLEDDAAFNFVNALEDFLWAFERRATASWIFQLAIKKDIYCHDIYRVAEKDWGADFRKLSAGSALVGLTLWLERMQDASLQGHPQSPKSVVLITGTAEYNLVSLNSTLKAFLWEMGSPFLPCKTRSGLLIAKAHSLRMWLKDSPFCLDLDLRDAPSLPEINSMQLIDGCLIRHGLVPAFKEITEKLGVVRPKKFSRLALLSDVKRAKAIEADIVGAREKLEKMKERGEMRRLSKRYEMKSKGI